LLALPIYPEDRGRLCHVRGRNSGGTVGEIPNGFKWVLSVPYIGRLYAAFFNPNSYFRLDTAMMFRDSVRSAVNEVINELRVERGLRALEGEALRPQEPGRVV
jgi:hypothetical protein